MVKDVLDEFANQLKQIRTTLENRDFVAARGHSALRDDANQPLPSGVRL